MPNALTFIIGADANPYAQEFKRMEAIAQNSARSISSRLAEGGRAGFSGIFREAITIPREILEGRGVGRILGSSTILLQYLNNLISGTNKAGGAAAAAAEAYDALALRQAKAAKTSLDLAVALDADLTANEAATEADLESAIAARAKSVADQQSAIALQAKAAAATKAAEAEEAEAAISGAGGGIIVGGLIAAVAVVATIAASIFSIYKISKENIASFAGFSGGSIDPKRIAIQLQGISEAAQFQKRLTEAVKETDDAYNSVAKNFERISEAAKLQSEHERTMLSLAKELALAKAKTPAQRLEAEKAFTSAELQQKEKERAGDLKRKQDEAVALDVESKRKIAEARALGVLPGENRQSQDREQAQKTIEDAKKIIEQDSNGPGFFSKFAGAATTTLPGFGNNFHPQGAQAGIDAVKEAARERDKEARERINAAQKVLDNEQDITEQRKKQEQLEKEAETAAKRAAEIRANLPQEALDNVKADQNAKDEAAKKEEIESEKGKGHPRIEHSPVNELQRIGAFARDSGVVAEQKKTNSKLEAIHSAIVRNGGGMGRGKY